MERFLSRALTGMAAGVIAIILVATAAVFLCVALYLLLVSLSATPSLAAFLAGLGALVLATLIILATRIAARCASTRSNKASGAAGDVNDLAAKLGSLAAQELSAQLQAHPYRAVVVSLLAGLAVGISPELRKLLEQLLKK